MNPVDRVTETGLGRRRGAKWAEYGPGVLPRWVAELAEPIREALAEPVAASDTGTRS
jgi:bifunctional pyridoxal-dependent enzyme with beta-cystathionase and maltose regulon repressor activities